MYVLTDDESGDLLVSAEEITGFFVAPGEELDVSFHGVRAVGRRKSDEALLTINDVRGERVGEYLVGRVKVALSDRPDVLSCQHFAGRCEYPEAGRVWRRWASGVALESGEWTRWEPRLHDTWLHVVQEAWFTATPWAGRRGVNATVTVDGAQMVTEAGLYCALGEAVNGPGGYYSSNLDALADCLRSTSGEGPPTEVRWHNFAATKAFLGEHLPNTVVEILREFEVTVTHQLGS